MIATVILRHSVSYRRDLFCAGLETLGYKISDRPASSPSRDDVLLIWNRTRVCEAVAARYERASARVIVAENGYLPRPPEKQFALALGHHNGAGRSWPKPQPRFELWQPQPWRQDGRHVLVLAQRGIGEDGVRQPATWVGSVTKRLHAITSREIVIRRHPGILARRPLERDLDGAWCAVTWGSSAALKAIVAGVPVFSALPCWIGHEAARPMQVCDRTEIEHPYTRDRAAMLTTLSWAQWSASEIGDGSAYRHLLA